MANTNNRSFLILHGLGGSGAQHWQTWLANTLRSRGENVCYPTLPDFDAPELEAWLSSLRQLLPQIEGEQVVICHSLSVLLWLHHAQSTSLPPVERLLLVAPPGPSAGVPEIESFLPPPLDKAALQRSARSAQLVCTDADPYCSERASIFYGQPLGLPIELLPLEAGHINVASGYGPWPWVEQWCLQST